MGRNENSEVRAMSRPVKARQKRGRNKLRTATEFKQQIITFSCIFCNQTFENTNVLFDHMRRVHPNLCEIPQITADSEIVEEISGSNYNNNSKSLAKEVEKSVTIVRRSVIEPANAEKLTPTSTIEHKYLSEDELSVDHLVEMVGSDEEMVYEEEEAGPEEEEEDEEEIESPPYEPNSDDGDKEIPPTVQRDNEDANSMEDDEDEGDYLSLMEPICEILNCNESEAEEFQTKLQESIKQNKAVAPKSGRGRRRDYNEESSDLGAGEGFFQCTVCTKSFPYAGCLARHVRSHTLNKPYQCSVS